MYNAQEVTESEEFQQVVEKAKEIAARTKPGNLLAEDFVLALLSYPNKVLQILEAEIGCDNLVSAQECTCPTSKVIWTGQADAVIRRAKEEVRFGQKTVYPEHIFLDALRWEGETGEALRKFIRHYVGNEGFFCIRARLTESVKK